MRIPTPFGTALLAFATLFGAPPAVSMAAAGPQAAPASDVDVRINLSPRHRRRDSVSLGIHLSNYPDLVAIPGMPVMYDPRLMANYFFYEGSFWVFEDDDWYRSDWYNGPWIFVERDAVPVFLLRIPVRYYNRAPLYFRPWSMDMAPRWSLRWGREWERRHRDWDRWDRRRAPPPAPPPVFQQQFPRERYPESPELQERLRKQHYRYRPREPVAPPPLQPAPVHPPRPQAAPPPPPQQLPQQTVPVAPQPQPPAGRERRERPPHA